MLNWSGRLISTPWPSGWFRLGRMARTGRASAVCVGTLYRTSDDPQSLLWEGLDGGNGLLPNISLPQIGTGHWPNRKPQHFAWWDWWRNAPPDEATQERRTRQSR